MHIIISKLGQNINQEPDQQIKKWIKTRYNSDSIWMQYRCNLERMLIQLDAF